MNSENKEKREPVCFIVGAMHIGEERFVFAPKDEDFVIAADGGYTNLKRIDYKPDLVIGDFDSIDAEPDVENKIRLPKEKDDTDTLFAVRLGLEKGYKKVVILGGIGGRLDHTLANIQTLIFIAEHGAKGFLVGEGYVITAVKDGKITFSPEKKGLISVFCGGGEARGVYLKGLKYPLVNYTLTNTVPIGVSNEFVGTESSVEVKKGTLIVMWNE